MHNTRYRPFFSGIHTSGENTTNVLYSNKPYLIDYATRELRRVLNVDVDDVLHVDSIPTLRNALELMSTVPFNGEQWLVVLQISILPEKELRSFIQDVHKAPATSLLAIPDHWRQYKGVSSLFENSAYLVHQVRGETAAIVGDKISSEDIFRDLYYNYYGDVLAPVKVAESSVKKVKSKKQLEEIVGYRSFDASRVAVNLMGYTQTKKKHNAQELHLVKDLLSEFTGKYNEAWADLVLATLDVQYIHLLYLSGTVNDKSDLSRESYIPSQVFGVSYTKAFTWERRLTSALRFYNTIQSFSMERPAELLTELVKRRWRSQDDALTFCMEWFAYHDRC